MEFENMNPTENEQTSGGTEGVVTSQVSGSEGEQAGSTAAGGADRQKEQQHEFNAAMAAARRRAEKDTETRLRGEFDDDIRGMKIPNPMKPGTYFSSRQELSEYSEALRKADAEDRAQKSGRTAQEVLDEDEDRAYIRRKRQEEAEKEKTQSERKAQEEFIAKDILAFQKAHPDVDIAKLDTNKAFRRFAGSRYGKEPLAQLYEDYAELVGEVKAAEAVRKGDKEERSTGAGASGSSGTLSAAQRAELRRWNENNPDMKMTEKEFLER